MKNIMLLILAASSCAFAQSQGNVATPGAQDGGNVFYYQSQSTSVVPGITMGAFGSASGTAPIQGAPYSASITNESIQTLADGNRIVQNTTGAVARDSLGRTRQEIALPAIGNLSAAHAPQIVFIQDPVTQTSYTLNLTDKTAQKLANFTAALERPGAAGGPTTATIVAGSAMPAAAPPPPPGLPPAQMLFLQRGAATNTQAQPATEDLGSQTIEGVLANGTRTTLTIPAGQIGNDRPISVVTEVWTSPDIKAIVYSKRSDPRMGEQTFRLTHISRAEPDPSLFTVPADFQIVDGPQPIVYGPKQ